MRKGEQFSLTWDQVDLVNKNIHLDKTKNGSSRYVRLNTRALSTFIELRHRHDRLGYAADGPIFWIKDPSQWFDPAAKRAGIEGVTWHTLRHTFASRLVMRGVNLKNCAAAVGSQIHRHDSALRPLGCTSQARGRGVDRAPVVERVTNWLINGYPIFFALKGRDSLPTASPSICMA